MIKKPTNKQLLFTTVAILVCIVSYFFVRNNTNLLQDKPIITTPKERVDKTVTKNINFVEDGPEEPSLFAEKIEEPTLIEMSTYKGLCDVSHSTSNVNVDELKTLENRSKLQLEAIERVLNKCDQWYDYWDSQSEVRQNLVNKQLADNKGLDSYFNNAIKERDKSVFDEAKSVVATGGDESVLSGAALSYMLQMDKELALEIGKRLNIKSPNSIKHYLKSNIGNIRSLYICSAGSNSCSKNSIVRSSLCALSEEYCNLSTVQHIANRTTANHFADLQQIVSIIRSLVAEGYFD